MKDVIIVFTIGIITLLCAQDVKISQGKLSLDGCVWAQCRLTKDTLTFNRRNAFIGLTTTLTNWASARCYVDIADLTGRPAYDLYTNLKPIPDFSIILGQFKLPLGMEVLTKAENLEIIEYSLIGRTNLRAPKGTRDIGLQLAYKQPKLEGAIACVNGNGRNMLIDDNNNKCFAGRFIVKPILIPLLLTGVNFYLGKYEPNTTFRRLGTEGCFAFNSINIKTELLYTMDASLKGLGFYIHTNSTWKTLQPVIRFSSYKQQNDDRSNELTLGLNFRPLADNLKLMLNYKYEKTGQTQKHYSLVGQLQIAF